MLKYKILSGSSLKTIAMISMLVDHTSKCFWRYDQAMNLAYFHIGKIAITPMFILSAVIGRLAFPIFAFLIVEGYLHTRNSRRYAKNLLLLALLSIIPWNLEHGHWLAIRGHNVMFTLFLGVVCIDSIAKYSKQKSSLIILGSLLVSFIFSTDYGPAGIALIITMYLLRERRFYQNLAMVPLFMPNKYTMSAMLASIPIMMYNGQRGFIKGNFGKYLMYLFYPLHLLILGLIKLFAQSPL